METFYVAGGRGHWIERELRAPVKRRATEPEREREVQPVAWRRVHARLGRTVVPLVDGRRWQTVSGMRAVCSERGDMI